MYSVMEKYTGLQQFASDIDLRMELYKAKRKELCKDGTLSDFANGHHYYGIHHLEDGWVYREWAPAANELYLTGSFNKWHWLDSPLTPKGDGSWELFLPEDALFQGALVKTVVRNKGRLTEHIPLYAKRAVQDPETGMWCCEVQDDRNAYPWTDEGFTPASQLLIYEAHIGMCLEDGRVGTYREFADWILPRIRDDGYTAIQLMAIMEHPYYGSFGYQVSSFYAASSRFGTPDDLKYLINKAHGMGLRVLLDVVHSHAVKNTFEGINMFDGTTGQFFLEGPEGDHPHWDTKCFDYSKDGVIHFLLSNLKFWLEEYHFDGFRFDGVTSMLYHDHGDSIDYALEHYFTLNTNTDAVTYLQLANELIREIRPDAVTIAEDVSGMPGICYPVEGGGIGFGYRLAMGNPDLWVRLTRDLRDEDWNMDEIWYSLTGRDTPSIAYVESHDQALVGDKTLMHRLAGPAVYTEMETIRHNADVERAIALLKLIRLITISAGGTGYLNFMGNEFGHPEWIDFPREGNGWSYHFCRRQWHLADDPNLQYHYLGDFDKDMVAMVREHSLFDEEFPQLLWVHCDDHVIAFRRKDLLFIFNFDPVRSYTDYRIPVYEGGDYRVVMTTDDWKYGGQGRIWHENHSAQIPGDKDAAVMLYLPARTATVLSPV